MDEPRDDRTEVDPAVVSPTEVDGVPVTGELSAGAQLGHFVIERVAGRGGMGVVYRAKQLRPSRTVALKVVSPEFADDAEFRTRFEHECEIAASIEHSNVIPVYEVGEQSGLLYIAMRYVEGTDLRAVIAAEGRLSPARAIGILSQLSAALDAAHAHGLVHRDVKPGNVLLAREGDREQVYLTDFGLAKPASNAGRTRVGMFVGTLDYAAPEQLEGQRVDARTDVYAAGCVLYEMLTGQRPVRAGARGVDHLCAHDEPAAVRAGARSRPAAGDRRGDRARDGEGPGRALPVGRRSRTRRAGRRRGSARRWYPSAASPPAEPPSRSRRVLRVGRGHPAPARRPSPAPAYGALIADGALVGGARRDRLVGVLVSGVLGARAAITHTR